MQFMVFWIVALLIALSVAATLITALRASRHGAKNSVQSDMAVYRDQLKEVDRDLARGVLTEAEAETVRTEVSRRLLDADARARDLGDASDGGILPAAALIVLVLLGGGYALYTTIGAPGYRDLPMSVRLAELSAAAATRPSQSEAEAIAAPNLPPVPEPDAQFLELMDQLNTVLETRPNDLRGLTLLARNEARLGNFPAARAAQTRILDIKGDQVTAPDLVGAIDIMVFGAGGFVSPEAEELIGQLITRFPANGAGQYYTGLTLAQNGRPDQAFPIWRRLLENGPQDAPWVPIIQQEITQVAAAAGVQYQPPGLRGPDADTIAAAEGMSDEDRQAMVQGMVEGLAERLATEGGTAAEWAQLIRALGVLGDTARARAIVAEAGTVFAADVSALETIEAAATAIGLAP